MLSITQLQWGHGDEAVEETRPVGEAGQDLRRFNGATAMEPWKTTDGKSSASTTELQWGHGDEAVEEAIALTTRSADAASMGPRR